MRLTYSVLCDSMQAVGSASNVSCNGSYQQPHYYYYILRRFTGTVKELLLNTNIQNFFAFHSKKNVDLFKTIVSNDVLY